MVDPGDHGEETAFLRGGGAAGELIARLDWASTPLGPLQTWSQSLKTATALLLRSPVPMMLLWGDHGVLLYNDACARLLERRHPKALGQKILDVGPEVARISAAVLNAGLNGRSLSLHDRELTLFRSGQIEHAWFDIDCSPVPDESGRPAGVLVICVETTQRVLAERRTTFDLERRRRIFEQAPGFICLLRGPDLIVEYTNAAHNRLFGGGDVVGKPYVEAFAHVIQPGTVELLNHLYATGERFVGRAELLPVPTPAGVEEHFLDMVLEPVTDDDGKVIGLFFEGFDVTEQVRAQKAVQDSERRLSAAIAIARLGAFEWDLQTGEATLDDRAREIFGFRPDEALKVADVVARIDPEDMTRINAENAAHDAAGHVRREFEYSIRRPDGSTRNIATVSDMVRGPNGEMLRAIGVFDDVTGQRAAERRQRMLINELNHRVKNTLATVQSIAAQTLRSAADLSSARDSFDARLVALAAAHDLLTAQNWHGARLTDVVATAMAPFETIQRPQISRSGPPAWLTAQRALALSLALHELATNAVKYGALSVPEGRVTIRWTTEGDNLTLCWTEENGPSVQPPVRAGFGTRLLQRGLAHEMRGAVRVDFAPGGVRCEIRCRVDDVRPRPEPATAGT